MRMETKSFKTNSYLWSVRKYLDRTLNSWTHWKLYGFLKNNSPFFADSSDLFHRHPPPPPPAAAAAAASVSYQVDGGPQGQGGRRQLPVLSAQDEQFPSHNFGKMCAKKRYPAWKVLKEEEGKTFFFLADYCGERKKWNSGWRKRP